MLRRAAAHPRRRPKARRISVGDVETLMSGLPSAMELDVEEVMTGRQDGAGAAVECRELTTELGAEERRCAL